MDDEEAVVAEACHLAHRVWAISCLPRKILRLLVVEKLTLCCQAITVVDRTLRQKNWLIGIDGSLC